MKTARVSVALFFALCLGVLAGCGTLGLKTADTFNDKAYVTVASIGTVEKLSASLVRLKTISANTGQAILDACDRATTGIAAARAIASTNPTDAASRLAAIDAALATIEGFLTDASSGKPGAVGLTIPAALAPTK